MKVSSWERHLFSASGAVRLVSFAMLLAHAFHIVYVNDDVHTLVALFAILQFVEVSMRYPYMRRAPGEEGRRETLLFMACYLLLSVLYVAQLGRHRWRGKRD